MPWKRISDEERERALSEENALFRVAGKPFKDDIGEGFIYRGERRYFHIKGPRIVGKYYTPEPSDKLPWED